MKTSFIATALAALALLGPWTANAARAQLPEAGLLKPCRVKGVEHEALCGIVKRPLDPAAPQGRQIDVHVAVLPALARHKKPDPIVFLAGGPGQSAIALAGPLSRQFARFSTRRDIVLVDQRGTGRSAPLQCDDGPVGRPMKDAELARQIDELRRCREALQKLPHGDLRRYTTTIAMQDLDAVRRALGVAQWNVIGASYGTRAALEYLRLYPAAVRRAVIDGVAPPDMVLPVSFSPDAQSAFDALLGACAGDAGCSARHPNLRRDWSALLAGLPRTVTVPHPLTGRDETVTITRDMVLGMVRLPLYAPVLASALPHAITESAQGRFVPLLGLGNALLSGNETRMASGMHFSVICAEDAPRMDSAADRPGADFGDSFGGLYRRVCDGWPRGDVPAAFYTVPATPAPVLVLSGGIDPVTPPRHGERVAKALGANAKHVVVANAGHGTMGIGCMRDVVFRFVDAEDAAAAAKVETGCAAALPRPPAFVPVGAASAASGSAR